MVKKVFYSALLAVIVVMLFSLVACGDKKHPYHTVMYGDVYEVRTWLRDDFYESNLTKGSWSEEKQEYVSDEVYPMYRTKIVTTKNEYDEIFREFPVEPDFEKSMIVMHCFTTSSGTPYEIKHIDVEDQTLIINYRHLKLSSPTAPNASKPLSKWVVVVMDKIDIDKAEFIFGK